MTAVHKLVYKLCRHLPNEVNSNLVNRKRWGIYVCQPPDVVPGFLAMLVLQIGCKVAENESVHSSSCCSVRKLRSNFLNLKMKLEMRQVRVTNEYDIQDVMRVWRFVLLSKLEVTDILK